MTSTSVRNSMTSSDLAHVICDPCRFNGKTTLAMKYCRECNGHLCHNCVNHHMKVSNTKHHHVSYILNSKTQNHVTHNHVKYNHMTNTGVQNMLHVTKDTASKYELKCIEHGKFVVSYCIVHDALCCRVCIGTGHRECKLQVISEAAHGSKDSRELRAVETNIRRLLALFEESGKEKQANLQHLDHQNDTFTKAVKSYRRTINNILDKLTQSLIKRKDRHYETKVDELKECLKTCQAAVISLNTSLNTLDIASRQTDEQHTFLAIKKAQTSCKRYEKIYSNNVETIPKKISFHFQPDLAVEKFLKGLEELGKLKDDCTNTTASPLTKLRDQIQVKDQIKGKGQTQAKDLILVKGQINDTDQRQYQPEPEVHESSAGSRGRQKSPRKPNMSPRQQLSPEELNVRIPSDKKSCSITGTVFLPDDKIVVSDATNKRVKVFSNDLRLLGHVSMQSAPRDVTMVSGVEVACTLPNDKMVQILQVLTREVTVKRTFKLDIEGYGITFYNNEFYITSGWSTEKEVQVLDSDGVLMRRLRPPAGMLKCPVYVTIDTNLNHVYVSDYESGVVGMDMTGTVIFRYQDDVTTGFMGICSTPTGEVFVCTIQPNAVSRVQTENKMLGSLPSLNVNELEPLMSLPNKGSQRPRSLAFSKRSNKLLVSFVGQNVDVLSIYQL